ncbi:MAG: neutral zinc metallopeptidase [Betaproteobacteria bacterium]|nr:MAG: neutral zinc metallopeptidase [Betaproteobacteria bacterium]
MRWDDFRRSDNVDDAGSGGGFGLGGGFRLGGGALIAVVVISLLLGKNPLDVLTLLETGAPPSVQAPAPSVPPGVRAPTPNDPQRDFVRAILGDTEDFWTAELARRGTRYQPPRLTLFRGQVGSACGFASAAMGPFYCPGDQRVYLDLHFFQELSQRFGAPGDFARAYVIAHEIGHHVQNQLGLMREVQQRSANASEGARNALSVRQELQADCFAGVWGHSAQQRGALDTRDIEQGIAAAASVGDDRLQQQARGYAVPESFTHGSSAQRVKWFRVGLASGDLRQCNTFASAGR